ncbi:MAG TPA: hypothetical protein VFX12_02245 [Vicinamibacterales bacterium]|nr:hypothetical protein [Vicinamibacterales bacterium]
MTPAAPAQRAASRHAAVVPLDAWVEHDWREGVHLAALAPLQRIRVWTRNSVYDIITGEAAGDVRVRGGRVFTDWTRARLAGSNAGGSVLKRLTIHAGLSLEFQIGPRRVNTSRVSAVEVLPDAAGSRPPFS